MNEHQKFLRWLLESGRLTGDGTVQGPPSHPITTEQGYPRWPGDRPTYTGKQG